MNNAHLQNHGQRNGYATLYCLIPPFTMNTSPAATLNHSEPIQENAGSSFFRSLSAPFVATPFLNAETNVPMPRVGNPEVPPGHEPLALPIFTSTGEWEWLNGQTFYDIHDLAVLHGEWSSFPASYHVKNNYTTDDEMHRTTVRACRAGDRTLAYINKS